MNRAYSAIVAVAGAVIVAIQQAYSDGDYSRLEKVNTAILAIGAYQVWQTANTLDGTTWGKVAKAVASGATAVLVLLADMFATNGDPSTGLIWTMVLAFLTSAGVLAVNRTAPVWSNVSAALHRPGNRVG